MNEANSKAAHRAGTMPRRDPQRTLPSRRGRLLHPAQHPPLLLGLIAAGLGTEETDTAFSLRPLQKLSQRQKRVQLWDLCPPQLAHQLRCRSGGQLAETVREMSVRDDRDALRPETAAEADEAAITAGSHF
mmetsp:Transcript_19892/g.60064  ORF Transcript_19892/g.60064 Transcript_19892/m.60064 type:complete len:131 (-) Transcript_19892:1254-1646(-)